MILTEPDFASVRYVAERALAKEGVDANPDVVARDTVSSPDGVRVVWHGGNPVAVLGAREIEPGVWRMFCFSTEELPRVILPLTKHIKRTVIPSLFAAGARRVEGASNDPTVLKWMKIGGGQEIDGVYAVENPAG